MMGVCCRILCISCWGLFWSRLRVKGFFLSLGCVGILGWLRGHTCSHYQTWNPSGGRGAPSCFLFLLQLGLQSAGGVLPFDVTTDSWHNSPQALIPTDWYLWARKKGSFPVPSSHRGSFSCLPILCASSGLLCLDSHHFLVFVSFCLVFL